MRAPATGGEDEEEPPASAGGAEISTEEESRSIWVGGIPAHMAADATSATLTSMLAKFGELAAVSTRYKPGGSWALVTYTEQSAAQAALAAAGTLVTPSDQGRSAGVPLQVRPSEVSKQLSINEQKGSVGRLGDVWQGRAPPQEEVMRMREEEIEHAQRWGTRDWDAPLWAIKAPGDGDAERRAQEALAAMRTPAQRLAARLRGRGDTGPPPVDSFSLRVDRVENEVKQRWTALSLPTAPPDRAAIAAAVEATGAHAGRALTSLLPAGVQSVSPSALQKLRDWPSEPDLPVLPEFMQNKISSQRTLEEDALKESEEIRQKFMLLYRNENNQLDAQLFERLLKDLNIDVKEDEARREFSELDSSKDGYVDMYEFEAWMKRKMREDERYMSGLKRIGHRGGWAKIKLPQVRPSLLEGKPGMAATRTQNFLRARHKKLRPSRTYLLRPLYMEYLYVEFVCKCIYVYFTYILDGAGTG